MRKEWRKKNQQEMESQPLTDSQRKAFTKYFVDSDETLISSLGNRYIESFIADGSLKNGFSIISNKRVYFRGSCLVGRGKSLTKSDEERVVDLKDVTGSGFIYRRHISILISLVLSIFVVLSASVFLLVGYSSMTDDYYQRQLAQEQETLREYEAYEKEVQNNPNILQSLQKEMYNLQRKNLVIDTYEEYRADEWFDCPGLMTLGSVFNSWNPLNEFIEYYNAQENEDDISSNTIQVLDRLLLSIETLQKAADSYLQNNPEWLESRGESLENLYWSICSNFDFYDEDLSLTQEEKDRYQSTVAFVENICDKVRRGSEDYTYPYDYFSFLSNIAGDAHHIDSDYNNEGDLCSAASMVIEHWKDTVQSILSYQKEGTPALTEKEQVRLQELEELIPVYQNLDAEISTKETTVSSLQRAASDEKTNNMIYTTITVIVTGLALGLIVLFANYLRKRKTYFEINYAGGKIAFNVSLYPKAEIMDFQKQLRRAKDFVSEQLNPEPVKTAEPTAPTISKADELEKYAALLEKGIITQEEFETLKRKALE